MEAQWRAKIHSQRMIGELEDICLDRMFDDYLARPHAETTLKGEEGGLSFQAARIIIYLALPTRSAGSDWIRPTADTQRFRVPVR